MNERELDSINDADAASYLEILNDNVTVASSISNMLISMVCTHVASLCNDKVKLVLTMVCGRCSLDPVSSQA